MIRRNKSEYIIKSVDHALDVMEAFRANKPVLGVTQLARILDLRKNNIFRILATLQKRGYVERNADTGNYLLGLKAFEAGQAYLRNTSLLTVSNPEMAALTVETRENAYLSVYREDYVVYLAEAVADQTIQVVSRLGTRTSAHCTATGKVFLAFVKPDRMVDIIDTIDLERMTSNTITDRKRLEEEVARVRDCGFAVDDEEWILGLRCVAAPIFDFDGKIQGALSVSGPSDRISMDRVKREIAPAVLNHGLKASSKMGFFIGRGAER